MIIRSCYHEYKSEEFEMEVVGEGIDDDFNEPCYLCKFLPKWQDKMQNGYGIHKIRKSLIGSIYEIKKGESVEQLSLW